MGTKKGKKLPQVSQRQIEEALGDEKEFRFRCTACGRCCQGPGEVYFSKRDLSKIFNYLGYKTTQERSALKEKIVQSQRNGYFVHSAGAACHFLDQNNRCRIYPVRPLQCRSFPFWPSTFQSRADLEFVAADCPGTMGPVEKTDAYSIVRTQRRVNKTARLFAEGQDKEDLLFSI